MKFEILLGYFHLLFLCTCSILARTDFLCVFKFPNLIDLVLFFFGKLLKLKNIRRVLNEQHFYEICHKIGNIEI